LPQAITIIRDRLLCRGADLPKVFRYCDEPNSYAGLHAAVVGGKNSAAETALDLFRNGAKVTMVHRGPTLSEGVKPWILPIIENRLSRAEIVGLFESHVREVRGHSLIVEGASGRQGIANNVVFVMIGYSLEVDLLTDAGVAVDMDTRTPQHDPQTMETNVRGPYVAGSIAGGNINNKIFIENGRFHGKTIVRSIAQNR
jgi:thioredoxin reductase (NADPH)